MIDPASLKRIADLGAALTRLKNETGRDEADILTTAGRGIARRAMDLTPTPKSVVSEGSQKKWAEKVIAKYFDRAAWPLDEKTAETDALKQAIREKNIEQAQAILRGGKDTLGRSLTTAVFAWDPKLVYEAMNRRGQVAKAHKYRAVFAEGERADALKEAQARVGKAKAGWAMGLRALGGSAPAWIARHSGQGFVIDKRNAADPSVEFLNRSKWAERSDEAARIRDNAMKGTTDAILKQARILMEKRLAAVARKCA